MLLLNKYASFKMIFRHQDWFAGLWQFVFRRNAFPGFQKVAGGELECMHIDRVGLNSG